MGLFNHSLSSISHYQYNSKTNQSCGTTIGHKLTSTQHTKTILSILASLLSSVISLIEIILCNILYFCFNIPFQLKFWQSITLYSNLLVPVPAVACPLKMEVFLLQSLLFQYVLDTWIPSQPKLCHLPKKSNLTKNIRCLSREQIIYWARTLNYLLIGHSSSSILWDVWYCSLWCYTN